MRLSGSSLEIRSLQTRAFETKDEIALLSAGGAALQDIVGYTIEATNKTVELVTASKMADATQGGQIAAAVVLAVLGGGVQPVDKEQKIRVSFVTTPAQADSGGFLARITFQRVVWNTQGSVSRVETLREPDLYEGFFDKLSKSVFLEGKMI